MSLNMAAGRIQEASPIKFIVTMVCLALFVIVGLTVLFGSWYTVDQTQRGVLLRNGAFVEVVQPGLHFKTPWIESVSKIEMTTQNFHWDKVNSYSADQQPADLKVSVTFHVSPDKVGEMYSRFSGDTSAAVNRLISPHINQQVKVVFGQYTAAKAITNRGQLNADVIRALRESLSYDPVFVIEGVQIENIDFSVDYIKSVEQRMQAEVEVQKLQQNLAREKVQADIAVTQATARANSVRQEAQATADAIRMRGEAEASAIQARAAALGSNPAIITLTQAERWNGALPQTMLPGSSLPFISVK
ncbi:prohibitin family protein [Bradyrhizobium elkanii]|uniref:prohibitin family protein n=1 Tax=Bradyrhizobium elkanii TaxID=29448 RepID=UPI00272D8B79|nr:prohibitin family protein [Bradyrhizobium elkanii]WLA80318.1 prohibitin family protein [Bradyrhizobium elkanii]